MKIKKELDETLDLVMLACSKGIDRGEILTAFAIDVKFDKLRKYADPNEEIT